MIYESTEELTDEDREILSTITDHIKDLNQQLYKLKQPTLEKVTEQKLIYEGFLNTAFDFLTRNTSSDAFAILAPEIYMKQVNSLGVDQLKQALGVYDKDYISHLAEVAIPLYSCSMGHPCDAESEWALTFCLGLKGAMFHQACDRPLQDFYWGYYLGPNLSQDVRAVLDVMKQSYENIQ